MISLFAFWLPILISAAAVFILSSIIHMAFPWHKSDYQKVPNEEKVMDALRAFALPPGDYMMPQANDMRDMRSPEFQAKMKKGPMMIATIRPGGQTGMGMNLLVWFLYSIVIGIFAAYVASRAIQGAALPLQIFRFVGVTTFLSYSCGLWQMTIWYSRSWVTTLKSTVDAFLYACTTACIFVWLWPAL
jgi:hypothetical protein